MRRVAVIFSFCLIIALFSIPFLACTKEEPIVAPVQENPTNPNLPDKPTLLLPDTSRTGNYILHWGKAAKALNYTLQEDEQPGFPSNQVAYSGADTTVRISGKTFRKVFYYRLRGNNNYGSGEWSATNSIIVLQLPAPNLRVDIQGLDFGEVSTGTSSICALPLMNSGDGVLSILDLRCSQSNFNISEPLPFAVLPSEIETVLVSYLPTSDGAHTGTLEIVSNDPDDYPITVTLSGYALPLKSRSFYDDFQRADGLVGNPVEGTWRDVGKVRISNGLMEADSTQNGGWYAHYDMGASMTGDSYRGGYFSIVGDSADNGVVIAISPVSSSYDSMIHIQFAKTGWAAFVTGVTRSLYDYGDGPWYYSFVGGGGYQDTLSLNTQYHVSIEIVDSIATIFLPDGNYVRLTDRRIRDRRGRYGYYQVAYSGNSRSRWHEVDGWTLTGTSARLLPSKRVRR